MRADEMPAQVDWATNSPLIQGMGPPLPQEVLAARLRPKAMRTPKPAAGQAVWYRDRAYGPLAEATVVEVLDEPHDPSVYQYVILDPRKGPELHPLTGERMRELVDDPWWSVKLRIGANLYIDTREARIEGSPGWLPRGGSR